MEKASRKKKGKLTGRGDLYVTELPNECSLSLSLSLCIYVCVCVCVRKVGGGYLRDEFTNEGAPTISAMNQLSPDLTPTHR